jgi:hypothetical protein
MLSRKHLSVVLPLVVLGAVSLASGCSSDRGSAAVDDKIGSARLAVTEVPSDVSCIRIDAVGSSTVTTLVDVTPGQSADIELEAQPVGLVAFSAEAFPAICDVVTDSSTPTWLSDLVYATLTPGIPVNISLILHENGVAVVGVGFESGQVCHEAEQPCLTDADCCSGLCYPSQVCAGTCSDLGAACTTNGECCAGQCSGSTCCVPQGNACAADLDCCSGSCVAGSCEAVPDSGGAGGSGAGGSGAGGGGAGGGYVSACDNTGNCGDSTVGCTACALAGSCAAVSDSCMNDPSCLDFMACVGVCVDQTCADACAAAHPSGAASYDALIQCVYCQECPLDCSPATLGVTCN